MNEVKYFGQQVSFSYFVVLMVLELLGYLEHGFELRNCAAIVDLRYSALAEGNFALGIER